MTAQKNFIVYRSSAGSGKTYTLVQDYIRIALSAPHPKGFRNILAITFTNKAAEEMKSRVLKQLADLAENPKAELMPQLTKDLNANFEDIQKRASDTLRMMLHNYSELAICTIDKFMHQLVRAFSRDLMLSYDFDVETDSTPLVEEAVARLLEQVGRDKLATDILVDYVASQIENDKSWQIERQLVETSVKTFSPQNDPYLKLLEEFPVEAFEQAKTKLRQLIHRFEHDLTNIGRAAMDLITKRGLTDRDFSYKSRGVHGYFKKMAAGNILNPANSFVQKCIDQGNFTDSKVDAASITAVESITAELISYCHQADQIRSERMPQYLLANELFKSFHQLLLLNELHKSLTQLKEEKNLIFVDDFHALISNVVKNEPAPFIYERTGQRFRHLLIDEFQDTSILQWSNFLPLVTDSLGNGGRVLLVGDGKQAIYRWRGGEVEQFDRLPTIYPPSDDLLIKERERLLENQYRPEKLDKNYRSLGRIVQFNNDLYKHLRQFIPESLSAVYNSYEQNIFKAEDAGMATTHLVDGKNKEETSEQYLQLTADYIAECLEDGYELRDICILTRSNKYGKTVVNHLHGKKIAGRTIEFISDESLLIDAHPLVKMAIAAFRHLSDPKNIGFQLDFLLRLVHQLESDKSRIHPVVQAFSRKGKKSLESVDIKGYLHTHHINWHPALFIQLNLVEMTEHFARLFSIEGFNSLYWSFFKQQILTFSTDHSNDLLAFLEWWEKKRDKLSLSIPQDSNAIQVMSVHKSKGLQFPVVIFPFADWNFKHNNASYWAAVPEAFSESVDAPLPKAMLTGLSSKLEVTPLRHDMELENARNLLDNLNLLYVGTTRAEERLYLLTKNQATSSSPSNIAQWVTDYANAKSQNENPIRHGKRCHRSEYFTKKEKQESETSLQLTVARNSGWKDKIRINLEAGELIDGEITTTHRAIGNLVHRILSEIRTAEDLEKQLARYEAQGVLDKKQSLAVAKQIGNLFEHPGAGKWFGDHEHILVEQAIVIPQGKVVRPDRVMINGQHAVVADFKTGMYQQKHEAQILQYGSLLQQMGYHCELYLYYLESNELKPVATEPQTTLF